MRTFFVILLTAPLCACATSKSVKNLAQSTGPLIAETQGTSSVVQNRFTQQNAVVDARVARWNEYTAAAGTITETPIALWTIDSQTAGATASSAKAKLLMLERVRAADAVVPPPAATLVPPPPSVSVSSAKLIMLLDGIAKGKLMTVQTVGAWLQATDKALADLKKDAEPMQEKK